LRRRPRFLTAPAQNATRRKKKKTESASAADGSEQTQRREEDLRRREGRTVGFEARAFLEADSARIHAKASQRFWLGGVIGRGVGTKAGDSGGFWIRIHALGLKRERRLLRAPANRLTDLLLRGQIRRARGLSAPRPPLVLPELRIRKQRVDRARIEPRQLVQRKRDDEQGGNSFVVFRLGRGTIRGDTTGAVAHSK